MTPDLHRDDANRAVLPIPGNALPRLTGLLWEERELLRRLQFNLTTHQLVVSFGEWEWLAFADEEICATSERLQEIEVLRSAEVDAIAEPLGLHAHATLRELAEVVPGPWPCILSDHDVELRDLAAAVDAAAARSEALINRLVAPVQGDGSEASA